MTHNGTPQKKIQLHFLRPGSHIVGLRDELVRHVDRTLQSLRLAGKRNCQLWRLHWPIQSGEYKTLGLVRPGNYNQRDHQERKISANPGEISHPRWKIICRPRAWLHYTMSEAGEINASRYRDPGLPRSALPTQCHYERIWRNSALQVTGWKSDLLLRSYHHLRARW